MTSKGLSRCQICFKMCKEEYMKGMKHSLWVHVYIPEKEHPPYPALEISRKEALADFKNWKKENKGGIKWDK